MCGGISQMFQGGNNSHPDKCPEQEGLGCSFLSTQDIEDGFSIAMDRKNITLLKRGKQVAWFSASVVSEEPIKAFIMLIKAYE